MESKYVSILEFSKMANVTKQAVYQRLDKDLASYCEEIDGRKCISLDALDLVGKSIKSSGESTVKQGSSQVEMDGKSSKELDRKVDLLALQIEEKDKLLQKQQDLIYKQQEQMRTLQEHIMVQSTEMVKLLSKNTQLQENYQVLFDRIQKREALGRTMESDDSKVENTVNQESSQVEQVVDCQVDSQVETPKTEEKKSFWRKIFG